MPALEFVSGPGEELLIVLAKGMHVPEKLCTCDFNRAERHTTLILAFQESEEFHKILFQKRANRFKYF